MGSMNRVFLMGNLTRDPQVRQTPSGRSVADLGLAVSERYRTREGEAAETTCFVDIVAWGRQAEACGEYLNKGAPVVVEGKLRLDRWETPEGEKRSRMKVQAQRVQFLGRRAAQGEETAAAANTAEKDPLPF